MATDDLLDLLNTPSASNLFKPSVPHLPQTYGMFSDNEPIAIVGSSCRFPGGASSPTRLWDLLLQPRDVLRKVPPERFNLTGFFHEDGDHHGTTNVSSSYFLEEDPLEFDAAFFKISKREAEAIDPQQRLLLENVYEAIESAGYPLEAMQGSKTGVFVGLMSADYFDVQMRDPETMSQYLCTGTARSMMANRLSYFFDWNGPSMTIDTACSSSLVAVHQAVQALRNNECNTAVAAGVNLIFGPETYISESKLHMLSPTGRSQMWDANADGYARGEGSGTVVLKLLRDAIRDGDHIESIIRETGVNSDGRTKGITMPSATSQADLIRQTYNRAGLDPSKRSDRCHYFEAHGTGTSAGDPIEAEAINEAFFPRGNIYGDEDSPLFVGSIKTIIGHLEGAAGIAGLLKASLAIQNRKVPPNMHFHSLNANIVPFYNGLEVPTTPQRWPKSSDESPLRASVNSFGFGGTNAHVLLESYESSPTELESRVESTGDFDSSGVVPPLLFSADSEKALCATIQRYLEYLSARPSINLRDLAWTLQSRRSVLPVKVVFTGSSREDMMQQMEARLSLALSTPSTPLGMRSQSHTATPKKILGVFTGQGAQWASMSRELILHSRKFAEIIHDLEQALSDLPDAPDWSLRNELLAPDGISRLHEAAISQPLCTAVQVALVDLLRCARIDFGAVVGHSSGEIAAAYAAGCLSAEDAVIIAYYRGFHARLAGSSNNIPGSMMAVGMGFDKAAGFCSQPRFLGRIYVAASNAPNSTTLSGHADAIAEAKNVLVEDKVFARMLKVDTAYHSPHMQACAKPYLASLTARGIKYSAARRSCTWLSSIHGFEMDSSSDPVSNQYWIENLTNPVLFSDALAQAINDHGPFSLALEIGPHASLKGPTNQMMQHLTQSTIPYCGALHRGYHDISAFSAALGLVWMTLGPSTVDFPAFTATLGPKGTKKPRMLKGLPSYAWNHDQTFWKESRLSKFYRSQRIPPHELLGSRIDSTNQEFRWRNILRLSEIPWLRDHKFQTETLFPAAGYCSMALEASKLFWQSQVVNLIVLQDLQIHKAIRLEEDSPGVEVLFTLTRRDGPIDRVDAEKQTVLADFICSACNVEATSSMSTIFTGQMQIELGVSTIDSLPPRGTKNPDIKPVDLDRFYSCMSDVGLDYTGLFRGLLTAKRRLFESSTLASKPVSSFLVHPALLDMCFQSIFVGYFAPGDESLQTPYLPSSIKRIQFNPAIWKSGLEQSKTASIDAFVTNFSLPKKGEASSITGDVDMFDEGEDLKIIQVEGLKCIALQSAEEIHDRRLFSHTVWKPDISSGIAVRDEIEPDSVQDLDLVDLCERLSYFYYRKLRTQLPNEHVPRMHRPLFNFMDYILPKIERGEYPTIKSEWLNDSYEQLSPILRRFPGQIDLELITSVGENLPAVVQGQSTMLEHMLADNMLNRFYRHGVGFQQVNTYLAKTAQQIAHRYPRMNILEVGAGTGGTTHFVLPSLGNAFASYTYTDVSSGLLHRAQEEFSDWAERMKFATLDIEQASSSQDFEDHSFDLIIASNVLHATRKLQKTLQNVRRLLKPGGYLLSIEVTGNTLRGGFIFGGLPGWWLGLEDGRLYTPTISAMEWNLLLRKSGFSGTDSVIPDFRNAPRHSNSLLVSQAVDALHDLLRQPLATTSIKYISGNLLVIGGSTLPIARLRQNFQELLSCWQGKVTVVDSLEAVNLETLQSSTTVLSITELDKPLFKFMTPEKFKALQDLFKHVRDVLWITEGCRAVNPYCNITVGLGRAILSESPYLRLQFFDVDHKDNLSPQCLCETFLRFMLAASPDIAERNRLWTTEPELALEEGKILVPRILPLHAMNERLNAHKRSIFKEAAWSTHEDNGSSMRTMCEAEASLDNSYENSFVRVHVIRSSRYAVKVAHQTFLFLCLGSIPASGHEKFLAFSRSNDSVINVPRNWTIRCDVSSGNEQETLPLMISLLIARQVFELEPAKKILIYSDNEMLCRVITSKGLESGRTVSCCAPALQESVSHDTVIFIHPRAPKRTIRSLLPSNISAFIDFSNTSDNGSLITECLPPFCSQQKISSYLRTESVYSEMVLEKKFDNLLQIVYMQSLEASQSRFTGSDLSVVRVEDLKPDSFTYPLLTSIIWTSGSLPVQIKPLDPRNLFRSNRSYLLVGLTGELGQSLCRWMVSNGARYIVVSSRSPQKACKWQQELERNGATIMVEAMDITNMEAVQMLYDKICARLPPIAGVANGAMVLSDSAFFDMDFESLNRVLRPKVDGSANMEKIFRDHDLDFFVMFSSLAAIVGNPGQANYAAANNFMSALAAQRRKSGRAASVVHIGMVIGVGYLTRVDRSIENQLRKQGYMAISEQDIRTIFAEAVYTGVPGSSYPPEIITGLQSSIDGAKPAWHDSPKFSHHHPVASLHQERSRHEVAASIKAQLASAHGFQEIKELLEAALVTQLQVIIQLAPGFVAVDRSLLELGIDSLMAVEIQSWFLKQLDYNFPVLKILGGVSAAELCEEVANAMSSDVSSSTYVTNDSVPSMSSDSGSISMIASTTAASSETEPTNVSMTQAAEPAPFLTRYSPMKPLQRVEKMSYAQSRLWFLIECLEDPTTYNCTVHYSLCGPLDSSRLEQAILTAAHKHEALRTLFFTDPETGEAKQGIMESPQFVWTHRQIGNEAEIGLEFQKMRNRVFDVKNGQTMAAMLLSQGHERHELVFGYNHIIMDGVSWQIFIREIASSYRGEKPGLSVAKQYVDFSNRQRELAKNDAFHEALKYYKAEFGEPPQPLPLLPFAKSGYRLVLTRHDVQTYNQRLDSGCSAKVRQASSRAKSTSFHFYLGALQVLLQRMLDVEDFCIGIADANRRDKEFENVVGLMVNVVPIRFKPKSEESFFSIIQHTRQHVLDALTHSPYLYHALMTNVENVKDASYSPLYQVVLNYIAGATYDITLNGCKLEHSNSEEARHPQDLVLTVREDPDGTTFISFAAQKYLYSLRDIEGLMAIYINLVKTLSTDTLLQLDKCELFDDSARQRTIELGRGPDSDHAWPDTLSLRVTDIVHQSPEALAVKDERGTIMTYAQMQARTHCIAESLHKGGVRQGMLVAVTCKPYADTICSLLAIWLIGATYVPLETDHGIKRLLNIVSDCKPAAIVCHNAEHIEIAHKLGLHQICDLSNLPLSATFSSQGQSGAAATAVLLYTSGSTGTPKGVLLSHANLKAQLGAVQDRFNLGKEKVLQQSSMGFDASLFQIFAALANGGTLIMTGARSDPAKLSKLMMEEKVSLTLAVPTEYSLWIGSGIKYLSECSSWRLAFCGGEKMTAVTTQAFSRLGLPDLQLINAYGPTETTVACSMGSVAYRIKNPEDSSNNSVIGFPLSGYQVYVLDERLRPLPVGWPGEICIGGAGVSAGYLNKIAETEKSFVRNPFTTDDDIAKGWIRLYRTGDRGQILEDGSINFIGRINSNTQIKLRGIRIELDEVSNAIIRTSEGAIREAVVIRKGQVDPFLVAFVVFSKECTLPEPIAYLRRLLLSLPLPPYMRPAVALPLTKFPVTTNGKINRSALDSIPLPQTRRPEEATELTLTEKKLAEIWKDLLPEASKSLTIDKYSNFFAVGGSSILLLMLQARIRDIANMHIPLPELFQSTTLEQMAMQVELRASIGNTTQTIDWALEDSISDLLLKPTESAKEPIGPPQVVLLTGVTGFLGSAILKLLIDTASVTTIHCVAVRNPTPELEALSPKIIIHSGDLSHPTLNLSPSTLLSFTSTIDAIIHNGAEVSFLKPFSSLRATNVSSTKFLVHIAAPRRIPFHFISSASVTRLSGRSSFPEASVAAHHPTDSSDGYTTSKWAGEMVLERASAVLGLPVSLYRPASIVGEGAPAKDILANVLGSSRRMRAVPRLDGWSGWFDLVAVETVAKGVVNGVMRGGASNKSTEEEMVRYVHLGGEKRFEVSKLRQFVQDEVGQTVRELDLQEWVTQARRAGLDRLVAEYLCTLDNGKGGVMLPLLDYGK